MVESYYLQETNGEVCGKCSASKIMTEQYKHPADVIFKFPKKQQWKLEFKFDINIRNNTYSMNEIHLRALRSK